LTLWTNAQGQLLNEDGRTIDRNGYFIDATGRFVDEAGNLLESDHLPVYGGTPVRLSGGTLDAHSVSITSSGNVNLLGQTGDLYFDGTGLASRTGSLQTRAAGNLRISGRHQTSDSMDIRGGTVHLLNDSVLLTNNTLHVLGNDLTIAGFVGSTDRIALNAVDSILVTGLAQAGDRINVAAGVSASWSLSQLTSDTITKESLTGGSVSVEESGVLDATEDIRVVSGGDFALSANAVVSPNLSSISEPIIVQTERTIEVAAGTRQVPNGTVTVDVVNWVPTQVTEAVGSSTLRVGRAYHTMDVTLTHDAYYNGTTLREYFVQNVDYENENIAWTSYERLPLGLVRKTSQTPAARNPVPAPEITATFAQLTDDQKSVVLAELGYLRFYRFSYANARRHQTVSGNTTVIPWTPRWADDPTFIHNFQFPGLTDKYILLPEGAVQDFLRIVSQGSQILPAESVGQYRDLADVTYYQDRSALTTSTNYQDYDRQTARWYVTAVPTPSVVIDGADQTVRNGRRQYEIFDGRIIAGAGGTDKSVSHVYEPIWYGGQLSDGTTDSGPLVATDNLGFRVMTQPGYLADTAWVADASLAGSRPNQYVGAERLLYFTIFQKIQLVESTGGWWIPPASYDWRPGRSRLPYSDPGYNSATQVESRGLSINDYLGQEFAGVVAEFERGVASSPFCFGGCAYWDIYGRADYSYHVYRKYYETYYDYMLKWTGKWHTITDSRDQ
jgi:hypothetical protein